MLRCDIGKLRHRLDHLLERQVHAHAGRNDRVSDRAPQLSLPSHIDTRLDRALIENEVPVEQATTCFLGAPFSSEIIEHRHELSGGQ